MQLAPQQGCCQTAIQSRVQNVCNMIVVCTLQQVRAGVCPTTAAASRGDMLLLLLLSLSADTYARVVMGFNAESILQGTHCWVRQAQPMLCPMHATAWASVDMHHPALFPSWLLQATRTQQQAAAQQVNPQQPPSSSSTQRRQKQQQVAAVGHKTEAGVAGARMPLADMVAELLAAMGPHLQQQQQPQVTPVQLTQQQEASLAVKQLAGQGGGEGGVTMLVLLLAAGEALAGVLRRLCQAGVGAEAEAGSTLLPLLLLRRPGSRLLQPVQRQLRRR